MFITRIASTVRGRTTQGAKRGYSPDGRLVAELVLACGKGTVKDPTIYIKVYAREGLAQKALDAIDMKGMNIEVRGSLLVQDIEGEDGTSLELNLDDVRKIKVFDRGGVLKNVLTYEVVK